MASVQVDSIGKECVTEGYTYCYKDKLPVGFLGLVDDVIGITEAGIEAQKLLRKSYSLVQQSVSPC